MKKQLLEFVISILITECRIDEKNIVPTSMMKNELIISSLDYVNLIANIEDKYNFELPDEVLILEEDISIEDFCDKIYFILSSER